MRSVVAVVVAVLAGAFAYTGLALGASDEGWMQPSLLLLPAALVSVMVVALVFLPLWSFLAYRTTRTRRAFVALSTSILVVTSSILVATGTFDRAGGLETASSLLIPLMVLIVTFATLMDPRRIRGGRKTDGK